MYKKLTIFLVVFLFFGMSGVYGQKKNKQPTAIDYLIKNLLLLNRDTGTIVLLPLATDHIKSYSPQSESKYWSVLKKYYPDLSKDSLEKRVNEANWINTKMKLPPFTLHFPKVSKNENHDLARYFKQYHTSIFSISNTFFSPDGKVCIVYIIGYQQGAFTVEIMKNNSGQWSSLIETSDLLE